MRLLYITLTDALGTTVTESVVLNGQPRNITAQANFVYGSGGTNFTAYLQTSIDNGRTWTDIASFQFTTSSARRIVNLAAITPKTTQVTPTDGSLTANTAVDGVLGARYRVKYGSTGTYAGDTQVSLDIQGDQIPAFG